MLQNVSERRLLKTGFFEWTFDSFEVESYNSAAANSFFTGRFLFIVLQIGLFNLLFYDTSNTFFCLFFT